MLQRNYSVLIINRDALQELSSTFLNLSSNLSSEVPCQNITPMEYKPELIPAFYSIIFIFGIIGNFVVITVLCFQGDFKSIASIYFLNLAVADIVFVITLPFWATYYAFGYNWIFGKLMCKISSSILSLNLFASIFFISCMSVDRYRAVFYPFQSQRRTVQQACVVSIFVWTMAIFSSLPTFYFRNTYFIKNLGIHVCLMDFPKENYSEWCVGISLMKVTLGFCVPVTVIGTCYLMIGLHLMRIKGPMINKQNRDRALKIVTAIVIVFLICWLPFHVFTFIDALLRMNVIHNCKITAFIESIMPFCICLGFSNSCINPLLYCFVGNQFREKFRHLFMSRLSLNINNQLNSSRKESDFKGEIY